MDTRTWVVCGAELSGEPPAALVGGKALNLARLAALGYPPPRWIALTTEAFREFGGPLLARAAEPDGRSAGERVQPSLRAAVDAALARAGLAGALLAVRSSAAAEDGRDASFAGQFDTVLGVAAADPAALWSAVERVWRSATSAHAAAYRARQEADAAGAPAFGMAVVLQELVAPAAAGVAFSVDPVRGDAGIAVVSAVFGLGEGLVSGELDADTYRFRFHGPESRLLERAIARKPRYVALSAGGGSVHRDVPAERQHEPVLSDHEALEVARTARSLADALGTPQDVEWALAEDPTSPAAPRRLVLLQTRPITTRVAPPGERRVWDNSNIVESYGGVTTPLTFSFARAVYEDVYRQFCRVVGVREHRIAENARVFANLLGLIRGRVYYNLLNWYRTLALLPGFSVNREFMERMMGVRERLADPPAAAQVGRLRDAVDLARMTARLMRLHARLDRDVPAFHRRVDAALAPLRDEDLTAWPADRLLELYRQLEDELLRHWQTPLVNDFFAMIWFGVLGRLVERWLPDAPPTLVNDLLAGQGGIVSAEPALRLARLADLAAAAPHLASALRDERHHAGLLDRLRVDHDPAARAFAAELEQYLRDFGDRCMNELKLETVTLRDDPGFLLRTLRQYLDAPRAATGPHLESTWADDAETMVMKSFGRVRMMVFRAVLRRARARVRDRENLRFERTRVFGVVRRIVLAMGARLAEAGHLERPRDVFDLTLDEVFGHVEGTSATGGLAALVALRRAEFEGYAGEPPLPERFETFGPPGDPGAIERAAAAAGAASRGAEGELRGTGCCAGVVRAPVRVVHDPAQAGELRGHIMVAERTDPGWTLLFPLVEGLLVQRGSLLSHSAIVARETGVPCVVGIAGLMDVLRDGDRVEMNGTTGEIRRLGAADEVGRDGG